jgi:hypothetical protein
MAADKVMQIENDHDKRSGVRVACLRLNVRITPESAVEPTSMDG